MEKKKKIEFIVLLDASDWDKEVKCEMINNDVSIHYKDDTCHIEWSDDEDGNRWKETKKWLIKTYGEEIMNYETFAIRAT